MSFQIESPYTVGELSGGKTVNLPVDLYLPDLKGVFLVINRVLDFYPFASGLPIIVKDVYAEQVALTVRAECFVFPSHVYSS